MRVDVCGTLSVEADGVVVRESDLPGRQGRRLWAYLVLHRRRPIGRDELATALWGDAIPDAWDTSLNAVMSRLRTAFRPVAIHLRGSTGSYQLRLPEGALIDRERAWQAIHHVHAMRQGGDVAAAWTEAVIAHEIAARGFLPGEAGEWIEAERRLLEGIALQSLEAVIEADLERGRAREAERVARELIGADALRESGYQLLMRALAVGGTPAQAARVMDECRSALAALGMAPSAETERVYRETTVRP